MISLAVLFVWTTTLHADDGTKVLLKTNYGDITVALYDDLTPITVANFLDYVQSGFYDGIIFHRVMDDFMIQTGIYTSDLYLADFGAPGFDLYDPDFTRESGDMIADEFVEGLENIRGTLAMANTGSPDSGSSQFFINQATPGNGHLDGIHTVFGEVVEGMDVVDMIAGLDHRIDPDMPAYLANLPFEPIIIEQASVIPASYLQAYPLVGGDEPLVLVTEQNERIQIDLTGPGELVVSVSQDSDTDIVLSIESIRATHTNGRTKIFISNLDNPGHVQLGEFAFERSLNYLACEGTISSIVVAPEFKPSVREFIAQTIREIDAPGCKVDRINVDNLGDSNQDTTQEGYLRLDIAAVRDVMVSQDVTNVVIMDSQSRNTYRNVQVGGVLNNAAFYGVSISKMVVANKDQVENAIDSSGIVLSNTLGHLIVNQGHIANDSYIYAAKKIAKLEILDGNLQDSSIETSDTGRAQIGLITVNAANHVIDDPNRGNITGSSISSRSSIKSIHADGLIDPNTVIENSYFFSTLDTVSSGGDCGAMIRSGKINSVLAGVDQKGKRLSEGGGFTGSDITGRIFANMTLKTVMATGNIGLGNEFSTAATVACSYGSIGNVFAEDGLNANISAGKEVKRVMVGFTNGYRRDLANSAADVAGSVNAKRLGRLYYTGQKDADMTLPAKSPIVVNVSGN
ncbi:MAG: peptidylprolyl isomerase [Phycisphaerae bacterium]|nr:peptidylprolyl isomerase [Phycisphaerae bacterium]